MVRARQVLCGVLCQTIGPDQSGAVAVTCDCSTQACIASSPPALQAGSSPGSQMQVPPVVVEEHLRLVPHSRLLPQHWPPKPTWP